CLYLQADAGIRERNVTGVQTCALPICDDRRDAATPAEGGATGRASSGARVGAADQAGTAADHPAARVLRGGHWPSRCALLTVAPRFSTTAELTCPWPSPVGACGTPCRTGGPTGTAAPCRSCRRGSR